VPDTVQPSSASAGHSYSQSDASYASSVSPTQLQVQDVGCKVNTRGAELKGTRKVLVKATVLKAQSGAPFGVYLARYLNTKQ